MALVMRRAMGSATRKAVLLAMADAANEDGCGIWKSADTIAAQSEISKRTVLRVWQELEGEGLILRRGTRPVRGGEVIVWDIDVRKVSALPKAIPAADRPGDTVSPGDTDATDPVTLTPRPGDTVSPNTSLTRPLNPSKAPALDLISENSSPEPDPVQQAVEYYNQVAPTVRWPQASKVTGKRAAALKARLKEFGLDAWKRVVDRAANTPWCCGQGGRKWFADIDYLSRESGFLKIYETLPQVSPQAKASPEDERRLNLERCFYQYGGGGAWRGREFGFPVRPDEPEAAGLYPDDLYSKYRVKRPQGAAA